MLDSLKIADGLTRLGFRLAKDNARAKKFVHADLAHPVYVKTAAKRGDPVYRMPLVVHPDSLSTIRAVIPSTVNINESWNNSNLIEYPKALNSSGNLQYYGVAVDVANFDELKRVVDSLRNGHDFVEQASESQSSFFSRGLSHIGETEVESNVQVRRGQDIFRAKLLSYWNEKCAVTGIAVPQILKSSHIKPWRDSDDNERLDVYNGLLLCPNLDTLFDQGLVTFSRLGKLILSEKIANHANELGLSETMYLKHLDDAHLVYLNWHRENIFVA